MSSAPISSEEIRMLRFRLAQLQLKDTKELAKAVKAEWVIVKELWGKYRAQKEVIQMLKEEVLHRPSLPSGKPISPSELPERDPDNEDNERYIDRKLPRVIERLGLRL